MPCDAQALPAPWADKLQHVTPVCCYHSHPLTQRSHCSAAAWHPNTAFPLSPFCMSLDEQWYFFFFRASCWSFDSRCRFFFTENHFLSYLLRSLIRNCHFCDKIWFQVVSDTWCLIENSCNLQHFYSLQGVMMQLKFLLFILKHLVYCWRLRSALCDWQL